MNSPHEISSTHSIFFSTDITTSYNCTQGLEIITRSTPSPLLAKPNERALINLATELSTSMSDYCCRARDARHCQRKNPGEHTTPRAQLPDVSVPHYEENCTCFSCRWVRETEQRFVLSKKGYEDPAYPVANPTHDRVPEGQRRRLLTPIPKRKFQIMYIYAMELEQGSWGWVAVLPQPLLPFLLTGDKYKDISRFARHPELGWFGLNRDGQRVTMDQEVQPPLYNPLYIYFGYDARCSPYRLYQPSAENNGSDGSADSSSDDYDISSTRNTSISPYFPNRIRSSSAPQIGSAPKENNKPSSEEQTALSPSNYATPTSTDQTKSASGDFANPPARARAATFLGAPPNTPVLPVWDNVGWVVFDPRCANPPDATDPQNDMCPDPQHNGAYVGLPHSNHHTDWSNTTLFVGGLAPGMTREDLHYWFEGFGELMHVRKREGQTHGFVQYGGRKEAEMAMLQMQGFPIFGSRLRLSWGNPDRHLDRVYWEIHRQQAWKAFEGYQDFIGRFNRGEQRPGFDAWVV